MRCNRCRRQPDHLGLVRVERLGVGGGYGRYSRPPTRRYALVCRRCVQEMTANITGKPQGLIERYQAWGLMSAARTYEQRQADLDAKTDDGGAS